MMPFDMSRCRSPHPYADGEVFTGVDKRLVVESITEGLHPGVRTSSKLWSEPEATQVLRAANMRWENAGHFLWEGVHCSVMINAMLVNVSSILPCPFDKPYFPALRSRHGKDLLKQ